MAEPHSASPASTAPRALRCGFCGEAIEEHFFRAAERFCCERCAFQIDAVRLRNEFAAGAFVSGAVGGLIVAVFCAVAWATIGVMTGAEWGFIAALIGYAVGKAVVFFSGQRRGLPMQLLAAGLALLGIFVGKLLFFGTLLYRGMSDEGAEASVGDAARIVLGVLRDAPGELFGGYDLLWVLLAIWLAWSTCRPIRIDIAGPFAYNAQPHAHGLQFDVAESLPGDPSSDSK